MHSWFKTAFAFFLLSATVAVCAQSAPTPGQVPTLSGSTLDGKPFVLTQARGKVTLVAFWATWCPACREELPVVRKFYDSNREAGLQVVTVSIDDKRQDIDTYAQQASWMSGQQAPINIWRKDKAHTDSFGRTPGTPTSYLLNRKGELVSVFRGPLKQADYGKISTLLKQS
jgi:thiol-disulfide isomerase/thioredoxin